MFKQARLTFWAIDTSLISEEEITEIHDAVAVLCLNILEASGPTTYNARPPAEDIALIVECGDLWASEAREEGLGMFFAKVFVIPELSAQNIRFLIAHELAHCYAPTDPTHRKRQFALGVAHDNWPEEVLADEVASLVTGSTRQALYDNLKEK